LFLAIAQLIVQLIYFLHMSKGSRSPWKLILLCFTAFIVCILVAGSLWIMGNLNTRMTPQQMDEYMVNQDSL
jgi:cytochrome o ubiquinol oxidase operon protein cyoD